jgi:hypothetical protein
MSAATVALYAAVIAGVFTLIGAVVGLVVADRLWRAPLHSLHFLSAATSENLSSTHSGE